MATHLSLLTALEPFIFVPPTSTGAEARPMLQETSVSLAVVGDSTTQYAIVRDDQLARLPQVTDQSLADHLSSLPPLLLIELRDEQIELEIVRRVAIFMVSNQVAGVGVRRGHEFLGVVGARALATIFPLEDLLPPTGERYDKLRINGLAYQGYICLQCFPPPPRCLVQQGDPPPNCPRSWHHGPMQPE